MSKILDAWMKRELTLIDIVGYLPYGLYCWYGENIKAALMVGITDYQIPIFEVGRKPILRPMSDLYVEITERGYNDGKPFVPLVEFAKVRYPYLTSRRFITDTKYVECAENDSSGWGKWKMYELELESMSVDELDLLHRLHLDYRDLIGVGLAVSVHDLPTNPYET